MKRKAGVWHGQKVAIVNTGIQPKRVFSNHCRETERRFSPWGLKQYPEASEVKVMRYLIVVEETDTGFSAYSPDLAGCVATGISKEDVG